MSSNKKLPEVSTAPVAVVRFPMAKLVELRGEDPKTRSLIFRPECSKSLPVAGEVIVFAGSDGAWRLRVLKQLPALRQNRGRSARFRTYMVRLWPRLLVEVLEVRRCSRCHGTGAIAVSGVCPECKGNGCQDCGESGVLGFSECPDCDGGRKDWQKL
jgi:hypothetical protein